MEIKKIAIKSVERCIKLFNFKSKYENECNEHTEVSIRYPGYGIKTMTGYTFFEHDYENAEPQTRSFIAKILHSDSVFLDIGANIGTYTLLGAEIATSGEVHAFEPTETFTLLEKNLSHYSSNVTLHKMAVGKQTVTVTEEIHQIWGKPPVRQKFNFISIDDFVLSNQLTKIDLIKIDTDGFEFDVLKGAQTVISQFRPKLIIELNEALGVRNTTIQQILDFLLDLRYDKATILDGSNFLFESDWKTGKPWPNFLKIYSNRDKHGVQKIGKFLKEINFETESIGNSQVVRDKNTVTILSKSPEKWAYSARISSKEMQIGRPAFIKISGNLLSGELSIVSVNTTGEDATSQDLIINKRGKFEEYVYINTWENFLVIRPAEIGEFEVKIYGIALFEIVNSNEDIVNPRIENVEIEWAIEFLTGTKCSLRNPNNMIESNIGYRLEQTSIYQIIEIILAVNPKEVLEIGTWEGFTSRNILETAPNCNVTSIDIKEYIDYKPYGSLYCREESALNLEIGWLASSSEFSDRFCKFKGNSADFKNFNEGKTYDLIFIDGSHLKEDVIQDTQVALALIKKGGLIIWDDYEFPVASVGGSSEVIEAISELEIELITKLKLFHIKGSNLLIGKHLN